MIQLKWEQYVKQIRRQAVQQGKSEKFIADYLLYAKPLFDKGYPVIAGSEHFAGLVGFQYEYMCKMAYATKLFYRTFYIRKSNGKSRRIDEPLPDLKAVQHWILCELLEKVRLSPYAKAFIKGKSTKDNARFHRAQKIVISLDIKDFFPSIRIDDVYNIFSKIGYSSEVSAFLANLCCLNNSLPQGAPTSPYLSNIRMENIDHNLGAYCKQNGWRYTRYADDMTFSGDGDVQRLIKFVSCKIYEDGFSINSGKTRIARQNSRQEVTGIVVNEHIQVPKSIRRDLRQQVYYIKKYGLDSHLLHTNELRKNYLCHLLGLANYAHYINPKDVELKDAITFLKALHSGSNSEDIN